MPERRLTRSSGKRPHVELDASSSIVAARSAVATVELDASDSDSDGFISRNASRTSRCYKLLAELTHQDRDALRADINRFLQEAQSPTLFAPLFMKGPDGERLNPEFHAKWQYAREDAMLGTVWNTYWQKSSKTFGTWQTSLNRLIACERDHVKGWSWPSHAELDVENAMSTRERISATMQLQFATKRARLTSEPAEDDDDHEGDAVYEGVIMHKRSHTSAYGTIARVNESRSGQLTGTLSLSKYSLQIVVGSSVVQQANVKIHKDFMGDLKWFTGNGVTKTEHSRIIDVKYATRDDTVIIAHEKQTAHFVHKAAAERIRATLLAHQRIDVNEPEGNEWYWRTVGHLTYRLARGRHVPDDCRKVE